MTPHLRAWLAPLLLLQLGATTDKLAGDGPLDFRCDRMDIETKPNRAICHDNVVVRRGELLVCCRTFEGFADEEWQWQRFICHDDVRAQRADESMWSERAEFLLASSDLILTGKPHVQRGKSMFEGRKVVVNVESDRANISQPRGVFVSQEKLAPPVPLVPEGKALPSKCPIPADPVH
ncbi:MAG: LptA/OstA family protein [Myxococcota bacterium]